MIEPACREVVAVDINQQMLDITAANQICVMCSSFALNCMSSRRWRAHSHLTRIYRVYIDGFMPPGHAIPEPTRKYCGQRGFVAATRCELQRAEAIITLRRAT